MRYLLSSLAVLAVACSTATPQAKDKIPITTKSDEARLHYEKGLILSENFRVAEAIEEFDAALKLDSGFASASALRAYHTPGNPGLVQFEEVLPQIGDLPEAEQTFIRLLHARWGSDPNTALTEARKLVALVPDSPRAHAALGEILVTREDFVSAVSEFERAITLDARFGPALNTLGYTRLQLGRLADAIATFQQYVAALPNEPNAYDSLGDALLAAGRYYDAEVAFGKAVELSPNFWYAHEGRACAKFYQGDFDAARAAFDNARKAAVRPADKVRIEHVAAMAALAEDRPADALKILDSVKDIPGIHPDLYALLPASRAIILTHTGNMRDALSELDSLVRFWTGGIVQPPMALVARRHTLTIRAAVEATMKDLDAVAQTVRQLRDDATANPNNKASQSALHFVTGIEALAKGDRSGALTHWALCSTDDTLCQGYFASTVPLSSAESETANATAPRPAVRGYVNARDPLFLYLRSRRSG